ncbi:hypothetical protein SteCoe_22363 [Stentor coeruleus]|uniref:Uncharacterized protein n=1 Tax=Stentor coeruleus TaxID=5963 RepID=A0A1R2BM76_9CILI|nr:hypothetical protein SteCoe_22363 [Stentor coeruleus]
MEVPKEILILTSIGRIKWLKAPQTLDEILFHLGKTFNVPELCINIKDCTSDTDVTPENYPLLVACDWECVFKIEVDYTLKDAIMVSLEESKPKVQRSPPRSNYSSTVEVRPPEPRPPPEPSPPRSDNPSTAAVTRPPPDPSPPKYDNSWDTSSKDSQARNAPRTRGGKKTRLPKN